MTDPLYQVPSTSYPRRCGPTRVALVVESPDGHTVAYELDGSQLDIDVEMKYERGSRSKSLFPHDGLIPERYDDPLDDEITLRVKGVVHTYTGSDGPWMVIKSLDGFPDLRANYPLASSDPDDSSGA